MGEQDHGHLRSKGTEHRRCEVTAQKQDCGLCAGERIFTSDYHVCSFEGAKTFEK
jgi:hypothetical protein